MSKPTIVFDLDGTLADLTHRLHFIRPTVGLKVTLPSGVTLTVVDVDHKAKEVRAVPKGGGEGILFSFKAINFKPDWDAFSLAAGDDAPIDEIILVQQALSAVDSVGMVIASGRSDVARDITKAWLKHYQIYYDALYMRKAGDHRQDYIIKREMLDKMRDEGFEPVLVFDDRAQVTKMWRNEGIRVAQVAEGEF